MQTQDKGLDAAVEKACGRFEAELKRGRRTHPLAVECLYTDDTKTLMSKGHQDPAEFMKACEEWYGGPLQGWGKVRHGSVRLTVAQRAKLERLGGAAWLRDRIDKAREST